MLKKLIQIVLVSLFLFPYFDFSNSVNAGSDFSISSQYSINLPQNSDFVEVEESVKISVLNSGYLYQPGVVQSFFIPDVSKNNKDERKFKTKSISIENQYGTKLKYTQTEEKDGIYVKVTIPQRIVSGSPYTIKLKYNTHDLINISGNITNLYIPALPKDTQFSETGKFGLKTEYTYTTKVNIPSVLSLPSFSQPQNLKYTLKNDYYTFDVPAKSRIGHTGWLQFGSSQYYKFKIVQKTNRTDKITPKEITNIVPFSSVNIYKLALPREYDETGQKISISNISPIPKNITRDDEGNLIAVFEVSANEESEILIEGYISLGKNNREIKDIPLSQYMEEIKDLPNLQTYIQPDLYWEADNPLVEKTAKEILEKSENIIELIENNYNYIIEKFEYSNEKVQQGNVRIGALESLLGGPAICMEYSDTLVALLRAQGIPSRAAVGYGNDPTGIENSISNTKLVSQKIGHQWVQVWIPNYGWLSVDPTWGESSRKYIGADMDHILWYTVGSSKQEIADTALYSADRLVSEDLESYSVYLQALRDEEYKSENKNTKSLEELVLEYKDELSAVDMLVKTTLFGRMIIYLLPLIATLLFTFSVSSLLFKLIKRKSTRDLNR